MCPGGEENEGVTSVELSTGGEITGGGGGGHESEGKKGKGGGDRASTLNHLLLLVKGKSHRSARQTSFTTTALRFQGGGRRQLKGKKSDVNIAGKGPNSNKKMKIRGKKEIKQRRLTSGRGGKRKRKKTKKKEPKNR